MLLFQRRPRQEAPNWSWEEHGRQEFQRIEHAEHRTEIAMVVVALMIVAAVAARLTYAYLALPG
jgi:hypothetical protein